MSSRVAVGGADSPMGIMEWVRRCGGPQEVAVMVLPCCTSLSISWKEPDLRYRDWGCWSPKREVLIWKRVTTKGS